MSASRTRTPRIDEPAVQIRLLPEAHAPVDPHGPAGSVQEAEAIVPVELLERLWRPSYLERLAHAYWRHLRRISLGLIRIVYEPDSRSIVFVHRRLVLLRFRRPRYDTGLGFGQVTWPIERGLLVAMRGRGNLRISVRRVDPARDDPPGTVHIRIRTEVQNFYPLLRGRGRFARIGAHIYAATELRIHVIITHGFLKSLARLDLPPSAVGALADDEIPL
jgi:hypothetical protein